MMGNFAHRFNVIALLFSARVLPETTMKINVVGTSGVGKSTLARRLAQELSLPYIEMDVLYWLPEWQGTPDDEFTPNSPPRSPRPAGAGRQL